MYWDKLMHELILKLLNCKRKIKKESYCSNPFVFFFGLFFLQIVFHYIAMSVFIRLIVQPYHPSWASDIFCNIISYPLDCVIPLQRFKVIKSVKFVFPNSNTHLVVYSCTWSDMQVLTMVFERLAKASLTLNLVKCDFSKAPDTYLGKQVGQGQVVRLKQKGAITGQFVGYHWSIWPKCSTVLIQTISHFHHKCCTTRSNRWYPGPWLSKITTCKSKKQSW